MKSNIPQKTEEAIKTTSLLSVLETIKNLKVAGYTQEQIEDIEDEQFIKYCAMIHARILTHDDNKEREDFFDQSRFMADNVADYILSKKDQKFITLKDTEQLYYYEDGIYNQGGESKIKTIAKEILPNELTTHRLKEIMLHMKISTYIDKEQLTKNKNLIALKNGLFDINTMEIKPFDPSIIITTKVPITYDEKADCPKIKKFISEILDKEDTPTIQEMIGYTLYRDYKYHKAFMLLGDGANGKSTLVSLIKSFLGTQNISAISIQDLEENRFASSQLRDKLANLFPDLPSKSLEGISRFKALTGNDEIMIENKFGKMQTFTNYAKMIFSTNVLPEIKEDTDAVFRRWMVITFKNVFDGSKCNANLINELTTDEELSGLLNWAIEGLKRLLQNNRFSNEQTPKVVRDFYTRLSSPIKAFCEDGLMENNEAFITKDEIYTAYLTYCKTNSLTVKSENVFFKKIKEMFPQTFTEKKTISPGIRKNCVVGISYYIKEENLDIKDIGSV